MRDLRQIFSKTFKCSSQGYLIKVSKGKGGQSAGHVLGVELSPRPAPQRRQETLTTHIRNVKVVDLFLRTHTFLTLGLLSIFELGRAQNSLPASHRYSSVFDSHASKAGSIILGLYLRRILKHRLGGPAGEEDVLFARTICPEIVGLICSAWPWRSFLETDQISE